MIIDLGCKTSLYRTVTIGLLLDEVLIEIFKFYLGDSWDDYR